MLPFQKLGIIGATSMVGECLLGMLVQSGVQVAAFSRQPRNYIAPGISGLTLQSVAAASNGLAQDEVIPVWVCLAPLWVISDYFEIMKNKGVKRVVALSSTSRFTKERSSQDVERALAQRIAEAEARLQTWAEAENVDWIVLRPTLIYGLGKDKNISEITRLIRRFGVFPLIGQARGLRQPVHVLDVAEAVLSAASSTLIRNKAYNISGAEILTYQEMINRVFLALGRKPCFVRIPLELLRLLVRLLNLLPRYRNWNPAMLERMNQHLAFDHADAARDLNYKPRPFLLRIEDIPN